MLEKLKKVKKSFDKRMLQKTNKQILWYIIVSYILWITGFLFILLKLDGNSIIVCLLFIIYLIFVVVMELYLGYHQFLASLRDDEAKKRELFKNGIKLNVVPVTLNVYKKIGDIMQRIIAEKQKSSFYFRFLDSNDYRVFMNNLIKDNKIAITAELIDEKICISIYYEGKSYHPKELKSSNFRWFVANFSVIK
jgi:hypothetical protein